MRTSYVIGDTHGYNVLYSILNSVENCDVYHVGNFGVGFIPINFEINLLDTLNTFLKKKRY